MLHYHTINKPLNYALQKLMNAKEFDNFRLVGGTALSLHIGHRKSVDIDLFSDAEYGSLDFAAMTSFLVNHFSYVDYVAIDPALGRSYFIGDSKQNSVKLDLYYTDPFIRPYLTINSIRMATIEDITAMKIDVVQRGGRKKDFWDVHALFDFFSIKQMLKLHKQRYPYHHNKNLILQNFTDFTHADDDFDPICLHAKYWELIKEDIEEAIKIILV
jgi:predicted nucleotidyltransferase component of viral defense system